MHERFPPCRRLFARLLAVLSIALSAAWLSDPGLAADRFSSGFRDLSYVDTSRDRTIPIALWYPTAVSPSALTYGRVHQGQAAPDAAFALGTHPLLLLSHGTGGNRFNQFHIGEYLATRGYVVAALEHPGDRTFDKGDFGTAKNLFNRPRDLRFALDALLADPLIAAHVDARRIGALGHSAGGFTAIVAAGGRPKLANLFAYCREQKAVSLTCPGRAAAVPTGETPEHAAFIRGELDLHDDRIRVAAVFAPAIGAIFDRAGLAAVGIPVLVFWAGHDEILNEPANSLFYVRGIANAVARPVPSIGHFGFLSLCSDLLRRYAPEICVDPPGVSRADFHQNLLRDLRTFLDRHLMPNAN